MPCVRITGLFIHHPFQFDFFHEADSTLSQSRTKVIKPHCSVFYLMVWLKYWSNSCKCFSNTWMLESNYKLRLHTGYTGQVKWCPSVYSHLRYPAFNKGSILSVQFNQCIVFSKMCLSFCLCYVVCLYKAIVCVLVWVCGCVCICLLSRCVTKTNPRQGFNNYRVMWMTRSWFYFELFWKKKCWAQSIHTW